MSFLSLNVFSSYVNRGIPVRVKHSTIRSIKPTSLALSSTKTGADIHADADYALRHAAANGHLDVVEYLNTCNAK
jgi:hypothetical protein